MKTGKKFDKYFNKLLKETKDECKDYTKEELVDHYASALANWDGALDQRDALKKELEATHQRYLKVIKSLCS